MKRPIFYGWFLVALTLFLQSIGVGTTLYMYSVIASAIGTDMPSARSVLMLGSTGMLVVGAMLSPFVGRLLDRHPMKWIIIGGGVALGVGFVLLGFSTRIWHVVLCYVLFMGVGLTALGSVVASTLLARWFTRYRGLAIGISALGTQFGGFAYTPMLAALIEAQDWRVAVMVMGVVILILVPIAAYLWVIDYPAEKHLEPDGEPAPEALPEAARRQAEAPAHPDDGLPVHKLMVQRNFIILFIFAGSLGGMVNSAVIANLSLFATDLGESVTRGAFLVSLLAFIGLFTSPLTGWLGDRINIKVVAMGLTLLMAVASLLYSVADSYPWLLIATLFQGMAGGGFFPLWALLVARLYHLSVYGQIMGTTAVAAFGGAAIGPVFAGWLFDLTDSYRLVFLIFLVQLLLVTALVMLLRPRDR
ncbi:MAG: MFS transporter [Gammaproteobacteria bacterium]|nr:MFS transporter [Gammaproteobacteria bacterium]